jgi:transposase
MIDWNIVKKLHVEYNNKQIAEKLNISIGSVQRIMRNINEGKVRNKINNPEPIFKRLHLSENEYIKLLNKLYWSDNLSQRKIAAVFNVHQRTIEISFKKYNIRTRSLSEASKWEQKSCNLTPDQIEIIDGLMLGDGHLDKSNVSARIQYVCKFKKILIDITKEFSQLHFSEPWGTKISNESWRTKNKCWFIKSSFYNDLLVHRNRWYKDIKIIPNDVMLTAKSFYWWFIGDGYIKNKCVELCTDNFKHVHLEKLQLKLNNLGYKSSITTRKRLKFNRDSSSRFINNIENNNNIAQEYQYKFNKFHEV